ncbi:YjcZ family sporulation protein [Anaerobacillus alkaliphilus]|uniref:YjcZ family sporulation protein n=2 Tax=Anaerobacillus alkaliphilus TaxID=1548597 RepID=A0A4Q0VRH6_9BACI|nr:YjcZ family sporulation protein [Anaerobacillus alkaliphilus]
MHGAGFGAGPMHGAGYGAAPVTGCGYGAMPVAPAAPMHGGGRGFALIVVLFILLVIIGTAWVTPTV